MHLAMNILQGKPYKKENLLQSTLVTRENAERMLMMRNELASQVQQVEDLHHKIDKFFIDLEHQRVYLFMTIIISILILIIFFFLYRELMRRHQQGKQRAQAKLRFFTDVSHRVRTPLTLIIDPIEQLAKDESIQGSSKEIINMVKRNAISLQKIVEDLLDEEKLRSWVEHPTSQDTSASAQEANKNTQNELNVNKIISHHEEQPTLLVIDDNEDIRNYIRTILSDSYTVLEAANGLDGLQLARKTVPD
jgi:signal transduction histidine kinase